MNAKPSNVYKIHKQLGNSDRDIEKARLRTFYFKKVRQIVCVGKTKQTTSTSNSVSFV